jgi:hypothetical protein
VRHEDGVTTRSVEHLGVLGPGRRYHPNGSHHRMTVLNPSNRLRPRTVRRERRNALVARGRVHSGRRTASADHRDPSSFRSRERPGADQRTTRGKQAAVMRYGYRRGSNLRRVWRCVSPGRVRGPSGLTIRLAAGAWIARSGSRRSNNTANPMSGTRLQYAWNHQCVANR